MNFPAIKAQKSTGINKAESMRLNWKSCDVISTKRISIKVKSSGYMWFHKNLSALRFSVKTSHIWNAETNTYAEDCIRQSDIYVFCLHNHTQRKTITLNRLKSLGAVETDYYGLREAVINITRSDKYA